MRAIHAVRELNEERDEPIRSSRCYTEAERHALFVRQADEATASAPRRHGGRQPPQRLPRLRARSSARWSRPRADAAWVGWGFVAEHPEFAELCERLGIVFVGPDAGGDARARRQDRGASGWPSRPACRSRRGAAGAVETVEEALRHATTHRLPADDQGRRGRRRARDPPRRRARTSSPPRSSAPAPRPSRRSATASVLMERLVDAARHVEVQVIADGAGRRVGARRARLQPASAATRR